MRLTGIHEGDLVECDVLGRTFFARVTSPGKQLAIMPLQPAKISYRTATSRQVVGHYRKAKGSR